jgi:hypothetical protein
VAQIVWGRWQREHIADRHGVSPQDFDAAWHDPDRVDLATERHEERGPYYVSIGAAALGKALKMVWRWHAGGDAVWPITAYFPSPRKPTRRKKR